MLPPLLPLQFHCHGLLPPPPTPEGAPAAHKPLDGAWLAATPLALPQALLISSCAEHCCVCPVQVQLQGPVPLTADAVPLLHRLAVGALVRF